MSEYDGQAASAYVEETPPENISAPVFTALGPLAIEASAPGLGTVGGIVKMVPGREGLVTMDVQGGPNICTNAETDEVLTFPDPCSWLGANPIDVTVTNDQGSAQVEIFIIVQDTAAFCGGP